MPTLYQVIAVALVTAFIILLIGKLGIRDRVITRAPRLISELFDCDFCLSFWISAILALILALFLNEMNIIFVPILSTPLARFLI